MISETEGRDPTTAPTRCIDPMLRFSRSRGVALFVSISGLGETSRRLISRVTSVRENRLSSLTRAHGATDSCTMKAREIQKGRLR